MGACLLAMTLAVCAQDEGVPTLHAYTNLIQIPVLALTSAKQRLVVTDPKQFVIRLNSGPAFHPSHMRLEGDDPLAVTVLADQERRSGDNLQRVSDAVDSLYAGVLHAEDRGSFYITGCEEIQGTPNLPQDETSRRDVLRRLVDRSLAGKKERCADGTHLWKAMVYAEQRLATQPGRRVLLLLADGLPEVGGEYSSALWDYADSHGISVFAISQAGMPDVPRAEWNLLDATCEMSGGMRLAGSEKGLPQTMSHVVALLRGRYIIEFPRPSLMAAEKVKINVSMAKGDAFVRVAGASVPVADATILSDPSTVPHDTTQDPQVGKRRVLTH